LSKTYRVQLVPAAVRALRKLTPDVQERVVLALALLRTTPRPPNAKKLRAEGDLYRIRVGDCRVLYQIRDKALLVLVVEIGHRREVYR